VSLLYLVNYCQNTSRLLTRCMHCFTFFMANKVFHWCARCTGPVSVVSQCKLVSGWGLIKRRSAPPCGPYGLRRTLPVKFIKRFLCKIKLNERLLSNSVSLAVAITFSIVAFGVQSVQLLPTNKPIGPSPYGMCYCCDENHIVLQGHRSKVKVTGPDFRIFHHC